MCLSFRIILDRNVIESILQDNKQSSIILKNAMLYFAYSKKQKRKKYERILSSDWLNNLHWYIIEQIDIPK